MSLLCVSDPLRICPPYVAFLAAPLAISATPEDDEDEDDDDEDDDDEDEEDDEDEDDEDDDA